MTIATETIPANKTSALRRPPLLGCMIIIMMLSEKMIAHSYTAITIYVLAGMLPVLLNGVLGVKGLFFNGLVDVGMTPKLASALWAFLYMFICFIPAYILYKKKIFIKV